MTFSSPGLDKSPRLQTSKGAFSEDFHPSFSKSSCDVLYRKIIEQFFPRFVNGARVIRVGSKAKKPLYEDAALADQLGLDLSNRKSTPDIIAFSAVKNWLYIIETTHVAGPISNERRLELTKFAENSGAGVLYITAFRNMTAFSKFAADIGWHTDVWIASEPDHMIHWNGDRFYGPRHEPQ